MRALLGSNSNKLQLCGAAYRSKVPHASLIVPGFIIDSPMLPLARLSETLSRLSQWQEAVFVITARREKRGPAMHQTRSPQIVKAHMSAVEFDSDPRLAGNETGRWGVSQPLAFVNCMSHIVLAGTVNWKRSRGFAVLMSFPWTRVILWIPEEPLPSPTLTDPSGAAKLFIPWVLCSSRLLHFLCLELQRGIDAQLWAQVKEK